MRVIRRPGKMGLQPPFGLRSGLRADVGRPAIHAGASDFQSRVVNRVMRTLAPEEVSIRSEGDRMGRMQFNGRVEVNVVGWTNQPGFAEVSAFREKRVEGLEVGVVRITVTAGDVGLCT